MTGKSTFPAIDIPEFDLWTFFFEREDRTYPDTKVLWQDADTRRTYTYGQTKDAAIAFGRSLRTHFGWKSGDTMALFTVNSIDTPVVTFGTLWAAGIVSPASPRYTAEELASQLKDCSAAAIITQFPMLKIALQAAKVVGIPRERIILIGDVRDPEARVRHFTDLCGGSNSEAQERPPITPKKDAAYLMYSSGTTGYPKGALLSHYNIVSNVLQTQAVEGHQLTHNGGKDGRGDMVLIFLPLFHIYGLACGVHSPLYSGFQVVLMATFDIQKFCIHVQNFQITYAHIVPPVALALGSLDIIRKYDLSSLRMLNSSAAPLSASTIQRASSRIKVGLKQSYGLTEASPASHVQPWGDWDRAAGSVGKLLPNMEAKYMTIPENDTVSVEVPSGEVGELYIRGPNIFMGYHGHHQPTLSPDGWFKTGDVGFQDIDGNLYITDRVKELIKYKGFQVAPAELEGILLQHDAISDVAVIGVNSPEEGTELPRAYVVRSSRIKSRNTGQQVEAEKLSIIKWFDGKVAPHKRLRGGIRFVDEIPKNPTGKILRRQLRELAEKEETQTPSKL
ncbi:uncharacterized protein N7469_000668 [Penicillium citrinum]|uniref:Uncharacterized protein n=1 Tax=Penicillium citrinum TaxID=5077 RepID=A0A9W9PDE3_PENCI|nr:uncharacterized protein N7469_000668 [Penicillium citrinum]KAJ5242341.1 hypothetical protein N7469_000668 [Penicillium citrinum]